MDYTGTGNSLNVRHPHSLQLIMDSLRYWVTEMHVDGFRFDLAATLAREFYDVDRLSSFFELVQQDPMVSQVKLIAEPWDVGPGGYQVGNFPPQWTEWNGKYRDTVRDFWRGEPGHPRRVRRPADRFGRPVRALRPPAGRVSINFVTAHDGFTLRDLVSYNEKHNEANGEDNNDGESHNRSWNCGVEGPTDDPDDHRAAGAPAAQLPRHPAAVPGRADDLPRRRARPHPAGQQQRLLPGQRAHLDRLGQRRRRPARLHPAGRRAARASTRSSGAAGSSTAGRCAAADGERLPDIAWLRPDGSEMTEEDWDSGFGRAVAVFLNGNGIPSTDARGERVVDDSFLLCFNAHDEPIEFTAARRRSTAPAGRWCSTPPTPAGRADDEPVDAGGTVHRRAARPLVVLQSG